MNKNITPEILLHVVTNNNPSTFKREDIESNIREFQQFNISFQDFQFIPEKFYEWCDNNSIKESIIHGEKGEWEYFLMKI